LSYIGVSLISSRGLFTKENEDTIHTMKHVISNPIQILKFFSLFRIFRISRILWQDVVTTEIIKIILISNMTTNAKSKWHCTHDYHFYFMIIIMSRRVLLSKMWASIKTKAGCNLYSKTKHKWYWATTLQ
jgi:dolichol kinase